MDSRVEYDATLETVQNDGVTRCLHKSRRSYKRGRGIWTYVGERHSTRTKERICPSSLSSALGISLNSLMLQISHGATVCWKLKMMSRKYGAEMINKTTNENWETLGEVIANILDAPILEPSVFVKEVSDATYKPWFASFFAFFSTKFHNSTNYSRYPRLKRECIRL